MSYNFNFPDGRDLAQEYGCKYVEVSTILNHHVDELLVGTVRQIKQAREKQRKGDKKPGDTKGCVQKAARGLVGRILKHHNRLFHSCDDLLTYETKWVRSDVKCNENNWLLSGE